MRLRLQQLGVSILAIGGLVGGAWAFDIPNVFVNGQVADADKVNENFQAVAGAVNQAGTGYRNVVPNITLPYFYTEICLKSDGAHQDVHNPNTSTADPGVCSPGEPGWVILRDEIGPVAWEEAMAGCQRRGMRLPEPFEFLVSCNSAADFGLNGMKDNEEWASNTPTSIYTGSAFYLAVPGMGNTACARSDLAVVGSSGVGVDARATHCVK